MMASKSHVKVIYHYINKSVVLFVQHAKLRALIVWFAKDNLLVVLQTVSAFNLIIGIKSKIALCVIGNAWLALILSQIVLNAEETELIKTVFVTNLSMRLTWSYACLAHINA